MVAENPQSTVISDYKVKEKKATQYQSEAEMEQDFIKQLQEQAYEYLPITSEEELIANLRTRLEKLNDYVFTDSEWDRFFNSEIANKNLGIAEKSRIIQDDYVRNLIQDDGKTIKNIRLIKKDNIHDNYLQVINQYEVSAGTHDNRYDVTILVNGLPLVHVELKRRGVDIKEAFNQIKRYNRESFWAGCGLFEYVQIFVISNGTQTKYYSNTTRESHIKEMSTKKTSKNQTSNSFEFTSYWALRDNRILPDIVDFTATFFAKHTILSILTKYCVFTSENLLLVMRPYQIAATESILQQIQISNNYKTWGKVEGGGYIWHTTGSGKTLTSFKTARLASQLDYIDKVLFVVDRKDLDYQTIKEYDRFEKGAANGNTSTNVLKKQLEDDNARIIITTIQKLSTFIKKNDNHPVFQKHLVMIFDECHRSQFGEMHAIITKKFKKYHLFGFTGTPIFGVNASSGGHYDLKTTEQAFGKQLHIYTIVDAIADGNVLPFRVDYVSTMKKEENIKDEKVNNIDREKALASPERISNIVKYILEHFENKTMRNCQSYEFRKLMNIAQMASSKRAKEDKQKTRLVGFNSIFAVASIETAKLYYNEFKRQQAELPGDKRLKVALIYSYGANEDIDGNTGFLGEENSDNTEALDQSSRDFLEGAIGDYNEMFKTNYDTSADKFMNYYKDVSLRMKNREIDILIVVNMFLTGFDATTLNTLWVDKNLRLHGLIQAYSRTNRILNSIKTFGNIICFRNLEEATNEAIALFGDRESGGLVLLKSYEDYYNGYKDDKGKYHPGYKELIDTLLTDYPLGSDMRTIGEEAEKKFIRLYGTILKATNILNVFDQFAGNEILSARDVQDYHSIYIDLYEKYRKPKGDSVNVNDDIVFEMELIKQVDINIDYILYLIAQMHEHNTEDKEIMVSIQKAINSSPDLRNKKELIENFIEQLTPEKSVNDDWIEFVRRQQKEQLDEIITTEKLKADKTYEFIENSFKNGTLEETGTEMAEILPAMPLFSKKNDRGKKKETVLQKLKAFFDKFFDISGGRFDVK